MTRTAAKIVELGLQVGNPLMLRVSDVYRWNEGVQLVAVGRGSTGVSDALETSECGLGVIAVDYYEGSEVTTANGRIFCGGGGTMTPSPVAHYRKLAKPAARLPRSSNGKKAWVVGVAI